MLKAHKVHFIAIGGYGMSGLAMVLLKMGVQVSGSDVSASDRTAKLEAAGATVHVGRHDASFVNDADVVVYSTQVPEDNPELAEARRRNLRVMHRSELLAEFINRRAGIAVTGTHGKTTTTSMISLLMEKGGLDPTILVGGELEAVGTGKAGHGPHVVAEADESDRSFLRYFPTVAVTLNIEPEHLEFYDGDFQNVLTSFEQFLGQVKPDGFAVLCGDDPHVRKMASKCSAPYALYGTGPDCKWQARNIHPWERGIAYDCVRDGQLLGEIRLPVPGRHNALNSLAAIAVGDYAGLSFEQMRAILLHFGNAKRRFQLWADVNDILVVDDYAHHPTEIRATLAAAKEKGGRRTVAVFQPQRYSRTRWLMAEFADAFGDADLLVLTEIYSPPGEQPIPGVTSTNLAHMIEERTGRKVHLISDKSEIVSFLAKNVGPGDTVLTMGAGDIWLVAKELAGQLKESAGVA